MIKAIKFLLGYGLSVATLSFAMYYSPDWLMSIYFFFFFIASVIITVEITERKKK